MCPPYLPVATVKLGGQVAGREDTEALVTAVSAVRPVVAHQGVEDFVRSGAARERRRKRLQRRPTGSGSGSSCDGFPPACTLNVASEHLVSHVTSRAPRGFDGEVGACEIRVGGEADL